MHAPVHPADLRRAARLRAHVGRQYGIRRLQDGGLRCVRGLRPGKSNGESGGGRREIVDRLAIS